MAQKRREPAHGLTARYRRGCRCERCKAANSRTKRQQRERARLRAGDSHLHLVDDVQADPQTGTTGAAATERPPSHLAGPMEEAVLSDLGTVDPKDKPFFQTLKAAAIALARELDAIDSKSSKAPLVKQIVDVVKEIKGQEGGADDPALKLFEDLGVDPSGFAAAKDRDQA